MSAIKEFAKKLAFRHTRLGAPNYPYGVEPVQLAEIVSAIERTVGVTGGPAGSVVEVGVARGMTSRFIAEHILRQGYDCPFYCVDTFSSFVGEDLDYEVQQRGKRRSEMAGFAYNDFEVWKRNFREFPFVTAIQADAGKFDFAAIAPIHVCFLDVDLYLPTKAVLNNILPHMTRPGVILVDDVQDKNVWDGSYQSFFEFVRERSLPHRVVGNKGGIIEIEP